MTRPILPLSEAVATTVTTGSTVYLGNFGAQLFSVGHEIIRQDARELNVIMGSGGLLIDQMMGAGVMSSATFGHCWSPVGPSPAWNFRRLAESGDPSVRITEMSLGMMTAALTAGAWQVPFMPFPGLRDTGYVSEGWAREHVVSVDSPFGESMVVQAITPDIAFVHVDRCDADGNGWIRGPLGEASVAASAARKVVLVAEELVDTEEMERVGINIPGVVVSAIVVAPGAVAPDGTLGRYDRDVAAYQEYVKAAATVEGFNEWLRSLKEDGAR